MNEYLLELLNREISILETLDGKVKKAKYEYGKRLRKHASRGITKYERVEILSFLKLYASSIIDHDIISQSNEVIDIIDSIEKKTSWEENDKVKLNNRMNSKIDELIELIAKRLNTLKEYKKSS